MPSSLDLPRDPAGLSTWILRQAPVSEDGDMLFERVGQTLNAADVPISRINVAAATLSTSHPDAALSHSRISDRSRSAASMRHSGFGP